MEDGSVFAALGLGLHAVAGGVGRLADLGVELAVFQGRLPDRDLLLFGENGLVAVGLGQRAGRGGLRIGGVGLGLDLGLLQHEFPLADRDQLLGVDTRILGLLPGHRLRHGSSLLDAGRLRTPQVVEVGAVVGDVLDLEGVENQTLPGQRGL